MREIKLLYGLIIYSPRTNTWWIHYVTTDLRQVLKSVIELSNNTEYLYFSAIFPMNDPLADVPENRPKAVG